MKKSFFVAVILVVGFAQNVNAIKMTFELNKHIELLEISPVWNGTAGEYQQMLKTKSLSYDSEEQQLKGVFVKVPNLHRFYDAKGHLSVEDYKGETLCYYFDLEPYVLRGTGSLKLIFRFDGQYVVRNKMDKLEDRKVGTFYMGKQPTLIMNVNGPRHGAFKDSTFIDTDVLGEPTDCN